MKRTFWFGLGIAAGVSLSRKANATARHATPAGLASNVGDAVRELADAIGTFGADVRAGMNEREQELNDVVEERSGQPVRRRAGVPERGADPRRAIPETRSRRARPAGS